MEHRHLWLRTPRQSAILRVRATIMRAAAEYFDTNGFIRTDPPILTPNACEGTSELFEMDYFENDKAYLTQSGQLYVEATALALGKVYSFGPTLSRKIQNPPPPDPVLDGRTRSSPPRAQRPHGSGRSLHHPHRHTRPRNPPRRLKAIGKDIAKLEAVIASNSGTPSKSEGERAASSSEVSKAESPSEVSKDASSSEGEKDASPSEISKAASSSEVSKAASSNEVSKDASSRPEPKAR